MSARYTCAQLGVCQARTPPCPGCTHTATHDTTTLPPGGFWFAPGTIIDHTPPRRERWTWLEIALAAICGSGVVGLVAGIGTMWLRGLL